MNFPEQQPVLLNDCAVLLVRVPVHESEFRMRETAEQFSKAYENMNPKLTVIVLKADIELELLSDDELKRIRLKRIPKEEW